MIDYKSRLKEVFSEVLESPVYNEDLVKKHFSQNYIQHVDGKTLYFEGFIQHMKALKKDKPAIQIDIKTLVQEGSTVFSNHLVNVITKENGESQVQVIGEFRFEGDQICYCDELSHLVSGDPKDRDLGSRV
ncbi:nuclear transport factor 2 family protein [Pedobacter sp. NJ-S-72]